MKYTDMKIDGYERVTMAQDGDFRSIIAVHNTNLGVALGGCRVKPYCCYEEQLEDNLNLAKGMTYKSALAGLKLGGGKATINASRATEDVMLKFADFLNYFNKDGEMYRSGGDVGTGPSQIDFLSKHTPHLNKMNTKEDSGYGTAYGVYMAMLGVMEYTQRDFRKQTLCINGLGKVGRRLAKFTHREVFGLFGADVNNQAEMTCFNRYALTPTTRKSMLQKATIYSPCALGGELDFPTRGALSYGDVVCGGANNIFKDDQMDLQYAQKGIIVVPDYLANAGGVIIINSDYEDCSYQDPDILEKLKGIKHTTEEVLWRARDEKYTPTFIANKMAEELFNV